LISLNERGIIMSKRLNISVIFLLSTAVFMNGCGNDESRQGNNQTEGTRPIGFYSNHNEDHSNDGPMKKMLEAGDSDRRFSTADVNYHGHLNANNRQPNSSNYNANESEIVRKVRIATKRVRNVDQVRSVSFGSNHVLIGITVRDHTKTDETIQNVKAAVAKVLNGQSVQVTIDEGTIAR